MITLRQPSSFVTGHPREFLRELSRINLFCIAISINNIKIIRIIMIAFFFNGSTHIRHNIEILHNLSCVQTSKFQDIYLWYINYLIGLYIWKIKKNKMSAPLSYKIWNLKLRPGTRWTLLLKARVDPGLQHSFSLYYIPVMTFIHFKISSILYSEFWCVFFLFLKVMWTAYQSVYVELW